MRWKKRKNRCIPLYIYIIYPSSLVCRAGNTVHTPFTAIDREHTHRSSWLSLGYFTVHVCHVHGSACKYQLRVRRSTCGIWTWSDHGRALDQLFPFRTRFRSSSRTEVLQAFDSLRRAYTHTYTHRCTHLHEIVHTQRQARVYTCTQIDCTNCGNWMFVVRVLENVSWTRHSSRLRLLLDRPDSAILSDDGGDATCLTQRTSVTSGSRLGNLDGARRNAAATATEVVRSQGPPRRATVIPASRTSPATTSSENDDDYLTRVATWKGRRHGWLKITRTFVALGSTSAGNFILLWELETWKPFHQGRLIEKYLLSHSVQLALEILYFCGNWRHENHSTRRLIEKYLLSHSVQLAKFYTFVGIGDMKTIPPGKVEKYQNFCHTRFN